MVKPASSVLYIQAPENFPSIEVIGQYVATPSWDLWLNFDLGLRGGEQSESNVGVTPSRKEEAGCGSYFES